MSSPATLLPQRSNPSRTPLPLFPSGLNGLSNGVQHVESFAAQISAYGCGELRDLLVRLVCGDLPHTDTGLAPSNSELLIRFASICIVVQVLLACMRAGILYVVAQLRSPPVLLFFASCTYYLVSLIMRNTVEGYLLLVHSAFSVV